MWTFFHTWYPSTYSITPFVRSGFLLPSFGGKGKKHDGKRRSASSNMVSLWRLGLYKIISRRGEGVFPPANPNMNVKICVSWQLLLLGVHIILNLCYIMVYRLLYFSLVVMEDFKCGSKIANPLCNELAMLSFLLRRNECE